MNLDGGIAGVPDYIFMNTPGKLPDMAELIRRAGAKPEIEAFNPGEDLLARRLVEQHPIDADAVRAEVEPGDAAEGTA